MADGDVVPLEVVVGDDLPVVRVLVDVLLLERHELGRCRALSRRGPSSPRNSSSGSVARRRGRPTRARRAPPRGSSAAAPPRGRAPGSRAPPARRRAGRPGGTSSRGTGSAAPWGTRPSRSRIVHRAVAADVRQRPQHAVVIAQHDHRLAGDRRRRELPRLGDVRDVAGDGPGAREDLAPLALQRSRGRCRRARAACSAGPPAPATRALGAPARSRSPCHLHARDAELLVDRGAQSSLARDGLRMPTRTFEPRPSTSAASRSVAATGSAAVARLAHERLDRREPAPVGALDARAQRRVVQRGRQSSFHSAQLSRTTWPSSNSTVSAAASRSDGGGGRVEAVLQLLLGAGVGEVERLGQELLPRRHVVVHERVGDPCLACDVGHAQAMSAVPGDDPAGGLENLGAAIQRFLLTDESVRT